MDPVTLILATMLAAAASDQSEKQRQQQKNPEPIKLPPVDLGSSQEALDLLGEAWPPNMHEVDFAWMDLMDAYGTRVLPWTHEQLISFKQGVLMCPLGHTDPDFFEHLELQIENAPIEQETGGKYRVLTDDRAPDRYENHGLIVCNHPGHDDNNKTFWFPWHLMELDF